jgi:hypothetical protein
VGIIRSWAAVGASCEYSEYHLKIPWIKKMARHMSLGCVAYSRPRQKSTINNYKLLQLQSTLLVSENYEGASDFAVALSADLIAARITSLSSFSSWQANFKAS